MCKKMLLPVQLTNIISITALLLLLKNDNQWVKRKQAGVKNSVIV